MVDLANALSANNDNASAATTIESRRIPRLESDDPIQFVSLPRSPDAMRARSDGGLQDV